MSICFSDIIHNLVFNKNTVHDGNYADCRKPVLPSYFMFLMQDPSSLEKAHEEVDRVLGGRSPTYEDMKNLKFLTRCITESLRLYPHPPVS